MNTRTQSPMEMVHRMSPGGEGQTRSERSFGLYRPVILLLCMFPAAFLAGCGGAGSPPIQNPMPTIASLSPSSAFAGDSGFTLTINGANFVTSSTVQWNGSSRTTTFVSSTAV